MSTIPTRRVTRTTRVSARESENANARPSSRLLTRNKVGAATEGLTAKTTVTGAAPLGIKPKINEAASDKPAASVKRKREALTEVKSTTSNVRRPGRENEVATAKAKEKRIEDVKPTVKPTTSRPLAREALRAVGGTNHVRTHSRSASVSTTASASDAPSKRPKVVTGKVTVKKESVVIGKRVSVFTKKPVAKMDDPEEGRVFKKGRVDTVAEVTAPVFHNDESQAEADSVAQELEVEADSAMGKLLEEPEAEAKPQLWDDLDAADWDDPASVAEYVVEVCEYLKEVELQTLPNANYMDHQREIDWEKRGVLVDWVLQVHAKFGLLQETFFLFVNILDRFLSARSVDLLKLQLVGITAFFIAAKYEETYCPSVTEIAYLAENAYTVDDILKAERYMLKTIGWDLRYPGPMTWLRRGSKADECDVQARTVAKYLIEIGCLEWRLVGTTPSMLAAAAMWLARLTLGKEEWTPNLAHYMIYSEEELLPTVNTMLNYILEPIPHESLYKKYAHKRYMKCSIFMRQWATERWGEGSAVDLKADLQVLKQEARLAREMARAKEEEDS